MSSRCPKCFNYTMTTGGCSCNNVSITTFDSIRETKLEMIKFQIESLEEEIRKVKEKYKEVENE